MISEQYRQRVLGEHEDAHQRVEQVASEVEDLSVMAGGNAWTWDSSRAVDALNDACVHLQALIRKVRETRGD